MIITLHYHPENEKMSATIQSLNSYEKRSFCETCSNDGMFWEEAQFCNCNIEAAAHRGPESISHTSRWDGAVFYYGVKFMTAYYQFLKSQERSEDLIADLNHDLLTAVDSPFYILFASWANCPDLEVEQQFRNKKLSKKKLTALIASEFPRECITYLTRWEDFDVFDETTLSPNDVYIIVEFGLTSDDNDEELRELSAIVHLFNLSSKEEDKEKIEDLPGPRGKFLQTLYRREDTTYDECIRHTRYMHPYKTTDSELEKARLLEKYVFCERHGVFEERRHRESNNQSESKCYNEELLRKLLEESPEKMKELGFIV